MEKMAALSEEEELSDEIQELFLNLPQEKNWDGTSLYQYRGFWHRPQYISAMMSFQRYFRAQDGDIIITSFPKSGTTWLKALAFTIVNRSRYTLENSPLLTIPPHDLVPFLEVDLFLKDQSPDLEHYPKPRVFATHVPHDSLSNSILNSSCRIVYICRHPLDQFVSHWKFLSSLGDQKLVPIDEAFEMFCNGVQTYGPIWEHILGYWKASQEEPQKVLFLKYEDMKEDTSFYMIKKLAGFLGYPFSEDEENQGVIEEISKFCSFNNLKDLEVNKTSNRLRGFKNSAFFRKGIVGDWKNYLAPSMSERLEKLLEEKLSGSGLSLKISQKVSETN